MPRRTRAAARPSPASAPRAHPLTRDEALQFRTDVIAALSAMPDRRFHGAIRAFARQLIEQHADQSPFDGLLRVERRLRQLERENVIRYDWGRSQNYDVVTTITLVDERAVHPPRRKLLQRREVASPEAQERRRMELLAALVHFGGSCPSVRELTRIAAREYGDHHRPGTLVVDTQSLERSRAIEKRSHRVAGRPVQQISVTANGRRALERYRQEHDGGPKPPAPTDIGAAPTTGSAPSPAPAAFLRTPPAHSLPDDRRQAILAELQRAPEGTLLMRDLCRKLTSALGISRTRGYVAVLTLAREGGVTIAPAEHPSRGTRVALRAPATPPPATPTAVPAQSDHQSPDAPSQTDGPLSEPVRAIDVDIGRANAEVDRLRQERAELERQMQALDRRIEQAGQRVARLEQLRRAALEAYADPPPAADNASEKR